MKKLSIKKWRQCENMIISVRFNQGIISMIDRFMSLLLGFHFVIFVVLFVIISFH